MSRTTKLFDKDYATLVYKKDKTKKSVYNTTDYCEPVPQFDEKVYIYPSNESAPNSSNEFKVHEIKASASTGSGHISAVFMTPTMPNIGWGDIYKSDDLLLLHFYYENEDDLVKVVYCPFAKQMRRQFVVEFSKKVKE